jgi:hypothetical protein
MRAGGEFLVGHGTVGLQQRQEPSVGRIQFDHGLPGESNGAILLHEEQLPNEYFNFDQTTKPPFTAGCL